MQSLSHWTPRYVGNRLAEKVYRRRHPEHPWLAPLAISLLDGYLKPSDVGLETGSGGSTLWFARRVSSLVSVEHNRLWHDRVSRMMEEQSITNVTYHLVEEHVEDDGEGDEESPYVQVARDLPNESLHFALVDGIHRAVLAGLIPQKLAPGGILIIDNIERFLPSDSISPEARDFQQGPASPRWERFAENVKDWRRIWTTNGVYDTAVYFKPHGWREPC